MGTLHREGNARRTSTSTSILIALVALAAPAGGDAPDLPARGSRVDAVSEMLPLAVTIEGDGVFGAGLLIDPTRGRVLTSHHVVEEMQAPRVATLDGKRGSARVIQIDRARDLALLEAPALIDETLSAPRVVDASTLRPGQEVYAIGTPRKLPFSVSRGVVSYVDRAMEGGSFVQLDLSINDGNSGGPVFTAAGEVIGVISFVLRRSQGIAFATPMKHAQAILDAPSDRAPRDPAGTRASPRSRR